MNQHTTELSPTQLAMVERFEEHMQAVFDTFSVDDALGTMVDDPYVNNVPLLTGGVGHDAVREFYSNHFIGQMPKDIEMTPISGTIGYDRIVVEMIVRFTHTIEMEWILPGVDPTGKQIEIAVVIIVQFRDGKIAHMHNYWDQASVLVQTGLIDGDALPIVGVESARKVLDPSLPSNMVINRTS